MRHFLPKERESSSGSKRFLQHLVDLTVGLCFLGATSSGQIRAASKSWDIDESYAQN